MSKIFITDVDNSVIDEIAWINDDGEEECIVDNTVAVLIKDDCSDFAIIKKDIPKLIKALEKAKQLGWWTDES